MNNNLVKEELKILYKHETVSGLSRSIKVSIVHFDRKWLFKVCQSPAP